MARDLARPELAAHAEMDDLDGGIERAVDLPQVATCALADAQDRACAPRELLLAEMLAAVREHVRQQLRDHVDDGHDHRWTHRIRQAIRVVPGRVDDVRGPGWKTLLQALQPLVPAGGLPTEAGIDGVLVARPSPVEVDPHPEVRVVLELARRARRSSETLRPFAGAA